MHKLKTYLQAEVLFKYNPSLSNHDRKYRQRKTSEPLWAQTLRVAKNWYRVWSYQPWTANWCSNKQVPPRILTKACGIILSYKQKFWASKLLVRRLRIKAAYRTFNVSTWVDLTIRIATKPYAVLQALCYCECPARFSGLVFIYYCSMALAGEQHETSLDLKKGDCQHCDSRSQKNF